MGRADGVEGVRDVRAGDGTLRVRIVGEGPPVLFVHGALVDGSLWDGVVERVVRAGCAAVVPELPLGSHDLPLPDGADRSPLGHARRLIALVDALGRGPVVLVGNDSGGAIAQVLAVTAPDRVAALVLTNCDALEVFPPPAYAYLGWLSRRPWAMGLVAAAFGAVPLLARAPLAYGGLARTRIDGAMLRRWVGRLGDPGVRRDVAGFFAAASPEVTTAAAQGLRGWVRPVTLVWGRHDPHFRVDLGQRLAAVFPAAELALVDARCYVPLDDPGAVAAAVAGVLTRARAA